MTPTDKAAAMSTPSAGATPASAPIAAASTAWARRLRRIEWLCWAAAMLFTVAWALSLYFRFGYQMGPGGMDVYDSQIRYVMDNWASTPPPPSGVFAGRIDRAGDLPWIERLGLTLPRIDHDSTPGRFDALSVDLPMWLVVGFYAAAAARIRRRRLHPDWRPRGTRLTAALWTGVTLAVAILAVFAAVGDIHASGAHHYAAARMNRFAFVWTGYAPHREHRIPDRSPGQPSMEVWAIEPPVFIARTDSSGKPDFVACFPSWMVLLPCVYMSVAAWRRVKPLPPNLCKRCRYDLTGNISGKCSECGRVIDWDTHGTRQ